MKNIIKFLGLIVFVSITFMACEDQKECKKETSSCDTDLNENKKIANKDTINILFMFSFFWVN